MEIIVDEKYKFGLDLFDQLTNSYALEYINESEFYLKKLYSDDYCCLYFNILIWDKNMSSKIILKITTENYLITYIDNLKHYLYFIRNETPLVKLLPYHTTPSVFRFINLNFTIFDYINTGYNQNIITKIISDINEISHITDNSLLMELINKNYYSISYNLIIKGSNVNYFNNRESALTMLLEKCLYGTNTDLCKILINNTNFDKYSDDELFSLFINSIIYCHDLDIVKLLYKKKYLNYVCTYHKKYTPLLLSMKHSNLDVIKFLIDEGSNINYIIDGTSVMSMLPNKSINEDFILYLLDNNMKPQSEYNEHILLYVIIRNMNKSLYKLIELGFYTDTTLWDRYKKRVYEQYLAKYNILNLHKLNFKIFKIEDIIKYIYEYF